jgi:predicted unusual protein kinase regulating ubiquinone biosynthesis (AarF/ABC1/UbiB family)
MEFVEGVKITSLTADMRSAIDTVGLLEQLVRAYLKQVLLDGFFHADPHPGNLALTPDGRIALLDLGMVAGVTPDVRDRLIRFMLAVSEGQSEEAAEIAAYMGEKTDYYDPRRYRRRAVELISRYHRATLSQIHPGVLLTEFTEISRECGIRVPRELAMLGKTLMHLDQATTILNPDFDPAEHVRKAAAELLLKHIAKDVSPGNVMRFVLALKDIAQQVPRTASFVLDQIANNELRLKIDAFDEKRLVRSIQKLANRVTLGILLGSLIVGAGLLSYVPTSFTILGYPAVAIIFFLIAASGALGLMWDIVVNDERPNRKKHR